MYARFIVATILIVTVLGASGKCPPLLAVFRWLSPVPSTYDCGVCLVSLTLPTLDRPAGLLKGSPFLLRVLPTSQCNKSSYWRIVSNIRPRKFCGRLYANIQNVIMYLEAQIEFQTALRHLSLEQLTKMKKKKYHNLKFCDDL